MKFHLYWLPGQPMPDPIPITVEVYDDADWIPDDNSEGWGWPRRWEVPEHVYRTHCFCEAHNIKVPEDQEVIGFRAPIPLDSYLDQLGNLCLCSIVGVCVPYPILQKKEHCRTPTDEDAKSRPVVQVRDSDNSPWELHTLVAVTSIPSVAFVVLRNGALVGYKQARIKVAEKPKENIP